MKRILTIALLLTVFSYCTKKEEKTAVSVSDNTQISGAPGTYATTRRSADNIDSLIAIVIRSIANNDKDLYTSYCFTLDQEEALAKLITDKKKKKCFQREFGFSLHEEVVYFTNIVNYVKKNNVDLSKVERSMIEVFDYSKSNYEPVVLKEVVIPIIQDDFERDIVFVAAQIDGRWYLTSELSL